MPASARARFRARSAPSSWLTVSAGHAAHAERSAGIPALRTGADGHAATRSRGRCVGEAAGECCRGAPKSPAALTGPLTPAAAPFWTRGV